MKLAQTVILSGILHNYILVALCCSPPKGWFPLSPTARVGKADIVIYGTVRASPRRGPKNGPKELYSALFEVHCSLKGGILPQFINVSGFSGFAGLCTHSNAYLNKTYIAFLRREASSQTNSTRFFVDELDNLHKATILVKHNKADLKDIVEMVGKNATLPLGATKDTLPGCPKFSTQPCYYPTGKTSSIRRLNTRHPRSHKHKKRRHKKCHVTTLSTQMTSTTKKLSSKMSDMSANERTESSLLSTTVGRHVEVEFLLGSDFTRNTGVRTQNISWCFVLIFHGLVLVVVKWHQTWFMALLRQGKQIPTQSDESALGYNVTWKGTASFFHAILINSSLITNRSISNWAGKITDFKVELIIQCKHATSVGVSFTTQLPSTPWNGNVQCILTRVFLFYKITTSGTCVIYGSGGSVCGLSCNRKNRNYRSSFDESQCDFKSFAITIGTMNFVHTYSRLACFVIRRQIGLNWNCYILEQNWSEILPGIKIIISHNAEAQSNFEEHLYRADRLLFTNNRV